jgi:hypothetical protein
VAPCALEAEQPSFAHVAPSVQLGVEHARTAIAIPDLAAPKRPSAARGVLDQGPAAQPPDDEKDERKRDNASRGVDAAGRQAWPSAAVELDQGAEWPRGRWRRNGSHSSHYRRARRRSGESRARNGAARPGGEQPVPSDAPLTRLVAPALAARPGLMAMGTTRGLCRAVNLTNQTREPHSPSSGSLIRHSWHLTST